MVLILIFDERKDVNTSKQNPLMSCSVFTSKVNLLLFVLFGPTNTEINDCLTCREQSAGWLVTAYTDLRN